MPTPKDIDDAAWTILAGVLPSGKTGRRIGRNENLKDQGMDSMALLKVISEIEGEFGITVEDEELEDSNFFTLAGLSDYLRSKLSRSDAVTR